MLDYHLRVALSLIYGQVSIISLLFRPSPFGECDELGISSTYSPIYTGLHEVSITPTPSHKLSIMLNIHDRFAIAHGMFITCT